MLVLRVGRTLISSSVTQGINIEHVEAGRDALEFLRLYDYDVMLVDSNLPDMHGYEMIRRARAAGLLTPSIMLAPTSTPESRIQALDVGADDVITAPFHPGEILARMRAVVRRSQGHADSVLRAGSLTLSLDRHKVMIDGVDLPVTRREFDTLELLLLKQGVILNKAAFLNHIYTGMEEPEAKTIDVIICRLRKKLAKAGASKLIDTVWGCGYIIRTPPKEGDEQAA